MPRSPKVPVPLESEIQKTLIAVAALRGIELWRNNSANVQARNAVGKTRMFRAGIGRGSPDLIGIIPGSGRFIAVEVKRPGAIPTPEQIAWLQAINRLGGVAFWANRAPVLEQILDRILGPDGYQMAIEVHDNGDCDLVEKWTVVR